MIRQYHLNQKKALNEEKTVVEYNLSREKSLEKKLEERLFLNSQYNYSNDF
jgi:hypothetical protein